MEELRNGYETGVIQFWNGCETINEMLVERLYKRFQTIVKRF